MCDVCIELEERQEKGSKTEPKCRLQTPEDRRSSDLWFERQEREDARRLDNFQLLRLGNNWLPNISLSPHASEQATAGPFAAVSRRSVRHTR